MKTKREVKKYKERYMGRGFVERERQRERKWKETVQRFEVSKEIKKKHKR